MPSGVFKPYAGVSTAILVFVKGGQTEKVWFYEMLADGYTLDDKRDKIEQSDLQDILAAWKERLKNNETNRKTKHFFVPVDEIKENNYDLSFNRYKEIEYEEIEYDTPDEIINGKGDELGLKQLTEVRLKMMRELQELLG